uniref:MEGF10_11 n=1 Tax=Magallana gigas TaxID=29159 RepID=A0A8W8L6I4_MAGGI|nr:uncharacterized protein LOC117681909 [Crassostrea gigas]
MCEGKKPSTKDGITYTCCYDNYYNGSTCVGCLAGFYGTDCLKPCDVTFYGEQCSKTCNCSTQHICHHIHGCIFEYSGSSEIPTTGYESTSTDHTPTNSKPPLPALTSTSPATDIQFPLQTNIFIFAIGSVMALFLGMIVVQLCIKLRIKGRKYTQQISVKRKPVREEETYNEINESIIGIGEDSCNEQRHFGRYSELQERNQLTGVPYDKMKTQAHYQEINNSLVELFCNSDSSNSDASYLNPKTNENHSYVDVMESSTAICGITIQDSNVNSSNDSSNVSSLYLQPVHIIEKGETILHSDIIYDNDDECFGVLHETIF